MANKALLLVLLALLSIAISVDAGVKKPPPSAKSGGKKKPPPMSAKPPGKRLEPSQFCPATCDCDCDSPPPSPPPPPPPLPPQCDFNRVSTLAACSQNLNVLPYGLSEEVTCGPTTDIDGRRHMGCTFSIVQKRCFSDAICQRLAVPRSLYLLADQVNCKNALNSAIISLPSGERRQVSGHWERDTCLRKYTMTTERVGIPFGSNVTVLLPATGACSDILQVCRPGSTAGTNTCKVGLADFEYQYCPLQDFDLVE